MISPRWSLTSRVLAATVGGYAFTSLLTLAVPLTLGVLGMNRAQALLAATTASFLVYAVIVMAVFHARSAARAWAGLVLASLPSGIVLLLLL